MDELREKTRVQRIIYYQFIFCYLALDQKIASAPDISRKLGRFDHSFARRSRRKIKEWLSYDKNLARDIQAIESTYYYRDRALIVRDLIGQMTWQQLSEIIDYAKSMGLETKAF
ncbi:hypothetical protein [Robiginitalea biformata]|nr:hypothetical protein [Robiginitalea biformata]